MKPACHRSLLWPCISPLPCQQQKLSLQGGSNSTRLDALAELRACAALPAQASAVGLLRALLQPATAGYGCGGLGTQGWLARSRAPLRQVCRSGESAVRWIWLAAAGPWLLRPAQVRSSLRLQGSRTG